MHRFTNGDRDLGRQRAVPGRGAIVIGSALATLLIAAGLDRQANLDRLAAMPAARREALLDQLRKFDLILTAEKRDEVRKLDRKIQELEPDGRAEALAVMRRFHDWLDTLPDNTRDDLLARSPGERIAEIKKLLARYPVPRIDTPRFLQIGEIGEFSPFELASIYKIWQALAARERKTVEQFQLGPRRLEALFAQGVKKGIPRETKPADFDDAVWIARMEAQFKKFRPLFFVDDPKNKSELRKSEVLRRQAINAYLLQHPPAAVKAERLDQFAASFPAWVQPTFDPLPPDEARRWLTAVYRLVFPAPEEIKPAAPSAPANQAKSQGPGPRSKPQAPRPSANPPL